MIKNLGETKDTYSTIIIGGGIVGAGVFRDLSLHDIDCLIIDKKDFSSQTSSKSSKMLHGGIRYLENFDFPLVWEALHEKNLWLKIAPHLCFEEKFYLPIYSDSIRPKWMIRIGLFLYDLLSSFENSPYEMKSKEESVAINKDLKEQDLRGSGVYHDAVVDDARLTIEVLRDGALNPRCHALNHTSLEKYEFLESKKVAVTLKDEITGESKKIHCKDIVFATGPFTDQIMSMNKDIHWDPKLLPSRGSHIWLDKDRLKIETAILLTPNDGRVIFVIPQGDRILVGTTESKVEEDYFDLSPSDEEITYLLANLNQYFPKANVEKEDILSSFAGIRPLVKDDSTAALGKTARVHKHYQPLHNCHVLVGGKYTTFRTMAQDVTRIIVHNHKKAYDHSKTVAPFRFKMRYNPFKDKATQEQIEEMKKYEFVRCEEDLKRRYRY
ncbi:FAD dependent oxidoreductase [Halobacteriovorax sp. BALOs_7]|uniref:glycerol-3-phosphate dehydrogenase/oxidase n=1 Tax=Halobacteriovorax sp. BALOs_7 TaxID=2109558 RepID=UPI000EA0CE6A|nr:glycerol-3-phosphate dehydrogenase/oxidase [Halobacteriovorax sp. BALOs_7]AYF44477.1 FAD dependent oxidoreductase [Halobacteriovorax sp. BALOs_7]